MKQKTCVILIDGSNLLDFDFSGFKKWLAGSDKVIQANYYVGAVRTDGTERTLKLFKNQRRLLVSSDTDLLPAIRKAREKGKLVEYIGFSHKIPAAYQGRPCPILLY